MSVFKNLPRFQKIWQTTFDDFGIKLLPLEPGAETESFLLALAIREAGRAILYPGYEAKLYPEEKWIKESVLKKNKNKNRFILKDISVKAFDDLGQRTKFLETAENIFLSAN
jgi:hypothetical protein